MSKRHEMPINEGIPGSVYDLEKLEEQEGFEPLKKKRKKNGAGKNGGGATFDTEGTLEAALKQLNAEPEVAPDVAPSEEEIKRDEVFRNNLPLYDIYNDIMIFVEDDKPVPAEVMKKMAALCNTAEELEVFKNLPKTIKVELDGGTVRTIAELEQRQAERIAREKLEAATTADTSEEAPEEVAEDATGAPKEITEAPSEEPEDTEVKTETPKVTEPKPAPVEQPKSDQQPKPEERPVRRERDPNIELRKMNKERVTHMFGEAANRAELEAAIRSSSLLEPGIAGSSGVYTRQELLILLDGLMKDELAIDNLPRACGFREAADRVYRKAYGKGRDPMVFSDMHSTIDKRMKEEAELPKEVQTYTRGERGERIYSYDEPVGDVTPKPADKGMLSAMIDRFKKRLGFGRQQSEGASRQEETGQRKNEAQPVATEDKNNGEAPKQQRRPPRRRNSGSNRGGNNNRQQGPKKQPQKPVPQQGGQPEKISK